MQLPAIKRYDPIWRPHCFDRVTVNGKPDGATGYSDLFSVIGPCFSEFSSGPNLRELADFSASLFGYGFYGLSECRSLGFRAIEILAE